MSDLFEPYPLGDLTLNNRIVMAPLTRSRASADGILPAYAADYYAQRASAGLIITEATNISPQAVGYAFTPGIWNDEQVTSWQHVTKAVHANQGKIFLQLWHTGRISHPDLQPGKELPVAPSAIKPEGMAFTATGMQPHVTPRALETAEIPQIVEDYRQAARNASKAGFDGVEIHSANNYLLEQFVRDSTNQRTDQYGGSIANRLRLPLAVVKAVTTVWDSRQVGIRLSPVTTQPGGAPLDSNPMETYGAYIDALNEYGLVYLHMIEGITQQTRETSGNLDFKALRERFKGAYMGNNQYTLELAEQARRQGSADLVSFGRPFIANPDLVTRLRQGAPLAEAAKEYWYGGNAKGYSDWPELNGQIEQSNA